MSEKLDALQSRVESSMFQTYARYPLAVARAHGSRLWDIDGKEYVDLLGGIAVAALGHCHEELVEALCMQSRKLWHVSNLFYQEEQVHLAELLVGTCHMGKAFFCNSGAEANEAAIKLARRYMQCVKKRDACEVITFSGCFHGRTLATLAATGNPRLQEGFMPMPEGFRQVPWNDLDALRAAITPRTAAVMVEVVQGEVGIRPVTPEYIQGIAALCREKDILLIADEVQAGLCRSGKFWAFQVFGVEPDILSTAKSLAGGLPMGAMLATDAVAQGFVTGSHATTFGGNALASAVAAKSVEIMLRDKLADRAALLGSRLCDHLRAVAERCPGCIKEVRGLGLLVGVELTFPGKDVWLELLQRGFVCNLSHDYTLRLLPPLNIDEADLDAFVETLEAILKVRVC